MSARSAAFSVLLAVTACSEDAKPKGPVHGVDQAKFSTIIREIESAVQLPEGAFNLTEYTRYYAYRDGKIVGTYLIGGPKPAGPIWVDELADLPVVLEGGCGVIALTYDPERSAIETIGCNGVA